MEPKMSQIYLITELSRLFWETIYSDLSDNSAEMGVSVTEELLLQLVWAFPSITVSELADILLRDKGTTSRGISELETRGLLERRLGRDRRYWELVITSKGEAVRKKMFLRAKESWREKGILGSLTPEEFDSLTQILMKIVANLQGKQRSDQIVQVAERIRRDQSESIDWTTPFE